jgi:hypothetical protein
MPIKDPEKKLISALDILHRDINNIIKPLNENKELLETSNPELSQKFEELKDFVTAINGKDLLPTITDKLSGFIESIENLIKLLVEHNKLEPQFDRLLDDIFNIFDLLNKDKRLFEVLDPKEAAKLSQKFEQLTDFIKKINSKDLPSQIIPKLNSFIETCENLTKMLKKPSLDMGHSSSSKHLGHNP